MKKALIISAICLLTGYYVMKAKAQKAGELNEQSLDKTISKKLQCKYLLYLPPDYDKDANDKWPLIMFLHGAGERGNNIEVVKKHGPPKMIAQGKSFDFIIVSPQCPNDTWWPEHTEVLINLLDEVEKKYRVDTDRVYLTGLSMGGFGTWALASRHYRRFAAIAPICGGGERYAAARLRNIGVWAFHGEKDHVVSVDKSKEMVEAINARGGNAKLTIYPDAEHDS